MINDVEGLYWIPALPWFMGLIWKLLYTNKLLVSPWKTCSTFFYHTFLRKSFILLQKLTARKHKSLFQTISRDKPMSAWEITYYTTNMEKIIVCISACFKVFCRQVRHTSINFASRQIKESKAERQKSRQ